MTKIEPVPLYLHESRVLEQQALEIAARDPVFRIRDRLVFGADRSGDHYALSLNEAMKVYVRGDATLDEVTAPLRKIEALCEPAPYEVILRWVETMSAVMQFERTMTQQEKARRAAAMADLLSDHPGDAVREAIEFVRAVKTWFPSFADLTPHINAVTINRTRLMRALTAVYREKAA